MNLKYFYKISYSPYTKKVNIDEYIGDYNIFKQYLKMKNTLEGNKIHKYTSNFEKAKNIAVKLYEDNFLSDIKRDIEYCDYCIKTYKNQKSIFNFISINKYIKDFEKNKAHKEKLLEKNGNFLIINRIPIIIDTNKLIRDNEDVYIVNNYINKLSSNAHKEYIKSSIIYREKDRYNTLYITYNSKEDKYSYQFKFEDINSNYINIPGYSIKAFFNKEDANKYCKEKVKELDDMKLRLLEFIESN